MDMHVFLITWMVILICLLVSNRLSVGLLGAITLLALIAVGAIGPEDAFSYITNDNNILIMSVFIISAAMFRSGLCDTFGLLLRRAIHNRKHFDKKVMAYIMLIGATASSVLPNTAILAAMLPAIETIASSTSSNRKKLLIAAAISTNLGGMITLIGTPTNMVANAVLKDAGYGELSFFAFSSIGIPTTLACIAFMLLRGDRGFPTSEPCQPAAEEESGEEKLGLSTRQYVILGLFLVFLAAVMLESITGIPAHLVAAAIAVLTIFLGYLSEEEAVKAMDIGMQIFVASCLAYSAAITDSGLSNSISQMISGLGIHPGSLIIYTMIFLAGCLISQVLSNTSAAGIVVPLVLSATSAAGMDQRVVVLVAVAGCNCSYLTPIASTTNIIVSRKAGMAFLDWLPIGLPLTLISCAIAVFAAVIMT